MASKGRVAVQCLQKDDMLLETIGEYDALNTYVVTRDKRGYGIKRG